MDGDNEIPTIDDETAEIVLRNVLKDSMPEGVVEGLLDDEKNALPIDAALEVEIRQKPATAFDESHYHNDGRTLTLHLRPGDAQTFHRELTREFIKPLMIDEIKENTEEFDL